MGSEFDIYVFIMKAEKYVMIRYERNDILIHFVFLANLFRETVNDLLRINNLYAIYFNFHCILSVYCYMLRFRFVNS
jgi:hypothetical protein